MIQVGDTLPSVTLQEYSEVEGEGCSIGPNPVETAKSSAGKTIALFAVPGAFTPTCHKNHLPGYLHALDALADKGVEVVAVTAVNDPFVMSAWAEATDAKGKIEFLADGNGDFAKAIGLDLDASGGGLGLRSKRYAMILDDMVVTHLAVEDSPGKADVSSAEKTLAAL